MSQVKKKEKESSPVFFSSLLVNQSSHGVTKKTIQIKLWDVKCRTMFFCENKKLPLFLKVGFEMFVTRSSVRAVIYEVPETRRIFCDGL